MIDNLLFSRFKPQLVKEIIHDVLHDQLSSKVYNVQDANKWGKEISDIIKNKVKGIFFIEIFILIFIIFLTYKI